VLLCEREIASERLDQSRGGIFSFSVAQVLGGVASVARLVTGYLRRIIWPEYPVNGQ
jgi:hypothetical protein